MAFKPLNKLKSGLDKFESFLKLSKHKVNSFRPKISFFVEGGPYKCRTAENVDDLIQCLKLRYSVFYGELLHREESVHGIDVDEMDILCDHLMIVEKESGQVVGTYRLASSLYTQKFYSQGEFELDDLLDLPGEKIELGRACIHKDHRSGMVMQLLWRGIAEYFKATRSRYLFGCTSIKTMKLDDAVLIACYAREKGWVTDAYNIRPTPSFRMAGFKEKLMKSQFDFKNEKIHERVSELLPALMVSYIRAGAQVVFEPALDKDFECIDFLTVLDLEALSPTHRKKFVESPS